MSTTCREKGFALVTAIFLLVALASVAAYLVDVIAVEHQSSALDLTGSRAYQAARAGIEWAAYSVLKNPSGTYAAACRAGPTRQTIDYTGNLATLHATVACTSSAHSEAGATVNVYRIVSTACNLPSSGACPNLDPESQDYVERQLEAVMAK
ncbi:MAG TPA: agglutinin biogenesis protein MshP [Burkholderiales bacterium]|nr:agglutinin biogenesis protein MshP [Burkholderiales bacterium]